MAVLWVTACPMEGHGHWWLAETTRQQLLDVSRILAKLRRVYLGGSTMTETVNNLMEANLLGVFNERDALMEGRDN